MTFCHNCQGQDDCLNCQKRLDYVRSQIGRNEDEKPEVGYYHDYSNGIFRSREECEADLLECLDCYDYADASVVCLGEIFNKFFHRKNDTEFCNWLFEQIQETEAEIFRYSIGEREF